MSLGEQLVDVFIGILGTAVSGLIGALTTTLFTLIFEPLLAALLAALGLGGTM